MGVDEECAALAREIQACDVRLGLLASDEPRNELFRQELQQRRHGAAQRLAQLEGNHRSSNE